MDSRYESHDLKKGFVYLLLISILYYSAVIKLSLLAKRIAHQQTTLTFANETPLLLFKCSDKLWRMLICISMRPRRSYSRS